MPIFNINPVGSHKKRKMLPASSSLSADVSCRHSFELDPDYGERYCTKCFVVEGVSLKVEKSIHVKENFNLMHNPLYDRQRWIDNVPYLLGQKNHELTDQTWLELITELPNPFLWQDAHHIFRKYNLQDWWICLPSYLGLPLPITKFVIKNVTKYIHLGNNSRYKINYLFLIYKFVQIESDSYAEINIPMHRTQRWMVKTDKWWKNVCREEKLPFFETNMTYVKFDKEGIIDKLTKSIDHFHLLNTDVSAENYDKHIYKYTK